MAMNWEEGICSENDILEIEGTPIEERDLPENSYAALCQGALRNPDATAISYFQDGDSFNNCSRISYRSLLRNVIATANALRNHGINRGDVVAYVLPNLPETHYIIWGASAAGRVLAINPLLEPDQIGELLSAAKVKVLVTLEPTPGVDIWEKVKSVLPSLPSLELVVTASVFDSLPAGALTTLMKVVSLSRSAISRNVDTGNRQIPMKSFRSLIEKQNTDALNFEEPSSNDVSTMLCTGGTTGLPKIALRTHGSEVYDCWAIARYNSQALSQGEKVLCGLPLFHSNAILVTGLAAFMHGCEVVLASPGGYRGKNVLNHFWRIVDHHQVATFSGVPTVYATLLELPRSDLNLDSVHFAVCGAAPMPEQLYRSFVDQTGIPIVEGYGLTEGAVCSSLTPSQANPPRIGSIGMRMPYQQMRCAILDDSDQFVRWSETDEVGNILISGPNVFHGYLEETQNIGVFLNIDERRWLNTGDLARQDEDGYFWMTGRKKELIIRGGHNIDPKTIEEKMQKHPAIALNAAIGRPDARVGEVPVLYYQKVKGSSVSGSELAEFANNHIGERAAIPKDFVEIDEMPMTAVGKIHKVPLNGMEIKRTVQATADAQGIPLIHLEVVQDKSRGLVAQIKLGPDTEHAAIIEALGMYSFPIDVQ